MSRRRYVFVITIAVGEWKKKRFTIDSSRLNFLWLFLKLCWKNYNFKKFAVAINRYRCPDIKMSLFHWSFNLVTYCFSVTFWKWKAVRFFLCVQWIRSRFYVTCRNASLCFDALKPVFSIHISQLFPTKSSVNMESMEAKTFYWAIMKPFHKFYLF